MGRGICSCDRANFNLVLPAARCDSNRSRQPSTWTRDKYTKLLLPSMPSIARLCPSPSPHPHPTAPAAAVASLRLGPKCPRRISAHASTPLQSRLAFGINGAGGQRPMDHNELQRQQQCERERENKRKRGERRVETKKQPQSPLHYISQSENIH